MFSTDNNDRGLDSSLEEKIQDARRRADEFFSSLNGTNETVICIIT